MYDIKGKEQGWLCIRGLYTMKQAKEKLKDIKRFDREQGIDDIYTIEKI